MLLYRHREGDTNVQVNPEGEETNGKSPLYVASFKSRPDAKGQHPDPRQKVLLTYGNDIDQNLGNRFGKRD